MDKMLVAVFERERHAAAATCAIKDLCEDGVLLVYAFAVIAKAAGRISVVDSTGDDCSDPVLGVATRNLIDLLAEPSCSGHDANLDATAGGKMAKAGIDAVFLDEVARHLSSGKAAIVAEIEEEMTTAMDAVLESQGGIVFRCVRGEIMDTEIALELDTLHSEIQALKKQMLQTPEESKAELLGRLDLAKARFLATKDRARQHAASIKREAEAKIVLLQERAAKAEGGIKAKLERLVTEVRVDYVNRATKLNFAWRFAGEVLTACFLLCVVG
jgi:uncharacterized membrane protein